MKKLLLILLLAACTHKPEVKPQVEPIPTVSIPASSTEYKKPLPMAKYQILDADDGHYVKQLKKGTTLVVIEGIPEKDDTCANGYAKLKNTIAELHQYGVIVSCYQSLSYEKWRCDADKFPASAKGKKMDGWDELWSDWRVSSAAHKFWDNRYVELANAGCDCVEDDNEYSPDDNETGFPLTSKDVEAASSYRAGMAHKLGMCHLAKNHGSTSAIKSKYSDGVMIEEAGKYGERDSYLPWKLAGKFAAMIEYSSSACRPYPGFSVQYHSDGDYFSGINYKICD